MLASLPQSYQKVYAGLPEVLKSSWANWKPSHPGPHRVVINAGPVATQYLASLLAETKNALRQDSLISSVTVSTTGSTTNVPLQVQQLNSEIATKPDLVITIPVEPQALVPSINRAVAQGIPVISATGYVPSSEVINVDANHYMVARRRFEWVRR